MSSIRRHLLVGSLAAAALLGWGSVAHAQAKKELFPETPAAEQAASSPVETVAPEQAQAASKPIEQAAEPEKDKA